MVFIPGAKNPFDSEEDRTRRLDAREFARSRRWALVFGGGVVLLVVFGVLAALGLPGTGVVLVPIALGMVLGGGIQLLLDRVG